MQKLAWIGLLMATMGACLFWGAGFKGQNDIAFAGLCIMGVGALVTGLGLIKMHLAEKRGF